MLIIIISSDLKRQNQINIVIANLKNNSPWGIALVKWIFGSEPLGARKQH